MPHLIHMSSNTQPADAVAAHWLEHLPRPLRPYLQLMRLDRPIGIWLLFWPCLMGLLLGTTAQDRIFSDWRCVCCGFACIGSRFGWLLSAKVALAFAVLAVFVTAVRAGMRGTMDPCRFRRTHHVVLCLMVGIVVLAKLMFY